MPLRAATFACTYAVAIALVFLRPPSPMAPQTLAFTIGRTLGVGCLCSLLPTPLGLGGGDEEHNSEESERDWTMGCWGNHQPTHFAFI